MLLRPRQISKQRPPYSRWFQFSTSAVVASETSLLYSTSRSSNGTTETLVPFVLADIGEGIKEVEIIQWFVRPNQHVQQFDVICQVQSDKATVEITSRYDGVIASLGSGGNGDGDSDGDSNDPMIIQVGQPLCYFYPNDSIAGTTTPTTTTTTVGTNEHQTSPPLGLGTDRLPLVTNSNSKIKDERTLSISSDNDTIDRRHVDTGGIGLNGMNGTTTIADGSCTSTFIAAVHDDDDDDAARPYDSIAQASPAVRRIAREYGIRTEIFNTMIPGTGPKQRILKSDVLSYVANNTISASNNNNNSVVTNNHHRSHLQDPVNTEATIDTNRRPSSSSSSSSSSSNSDDQGGNHDQIITLRGYTRQMISTMTTSLQIPHMCLGDEIIMNHIQTMRQQINDSLSSSSTTTMGIDNSSSPSKPNVKISLLALLLKAVSCAMLDVPIVNSIQVENSVSHGVLLQKQDHNFGIAIDTLTRGLVVPVIHQCQHKSIVTIQNEIDILKQLAYSNQLQKEHFMDLTFTVSNIGSIGAGLFVQPVIVPPTLAMGVFGCTNIVPRFRSAASSSTTASTSDSSNATTTTTAAVRDIYEAQVMTVTWAGDHRFLDGATLGRFHNRFRYYVEERPMLLLLNS